MFKRAKNPQFVSASGNGFQVNGSAFKFIGTNAYWLSSLNSDQDIIDTLGNMSAIGIKVVRTWAFNDVTEVPTDGTWFQLISNGTTSVNTGPNGLQRLDKVVEIAERLGMYVLLSLTNNWNPLPGIDGNTSTTLARRDITPGTDNNLNRNYLSNDYGGMDAYVRQFGKTKSHDEFYTDNNIINIFENYTTNIVTRYVDSTAVFGWELANDPRCHSSLPSNDCTAQTVTRWHSTIAQHIAAIDPNHLIGSGNGGFFCTGCPKLFPLPPPPPPGKPPGTPPGSGPGPGPSAAAVRRAPSKRDMIKVRAEERKRIREQKKRNGGFKEDSRRVLIRGRWIATPKRQSQNSGLGSSFDGSQGVDSQDILGIPQIGFSAFQLFPDQNQYAPDDPSQSPFDSMVQAGNQWIELQAQSSILYGKPVALNGFGIVTQNNAPDFVPFNSTMVANSTSTSPTSPDNTTAVSGISDDQRNSAYQQWLQTGITAGIQGMIQYQWGQSGLMPQTGTSIVSPNTTGSNPTPPSGNGQSPAPDQTGVSPNDGYTTSGTGQNNVQQILQTASQNISPA
jgi:mannan endo-1,4-beta-mannosidase